MANVYGNVSPICMQGQEQAPSFWLLAPSQTNPKTQTKTNPQTSALLRLSGENGGRP
jgi:hypothetical protein